MPLTPYTINIPLAVQPINQTQQAINDNFTCLVNNAVPANGLITVNHVGTNDPVNYGKHSFITFLAQNPTPTVAITYPDIGLYSGLNADTGENEIYFRNSNNVITDIPITAASYTTNGWSYMPSGIILQWGRTTGAALAGNSWNAVNFTIPFPNNCFNVSVTPKVVTPAPSVAQTTTLLDIDPNYTVDGFQVFNRRTDGGGGIAADCCWFAIGN